MDASPIRLIEAMILVKDDAGAVGVLELGEVDQDSSWPVPQ